MTEPQPQPDVDDERLSDADFRRVAEVMAKSVDEVATAEHVRLAIMITAATNEMFSIITERLAAEKDLSADDP